MEYLERFLDNVTLFIKKMMKFAIAMTVIATIIVMIAQLSGYNRDYQSIYYTLCVLFTLNILLAYLYDKLEISKEKFIGSYQYREYLLEELNKDESEQEIIRKQEDEKQEKNETDEKQDNTVLHETYEQKKDNKRDIIALMLKNNDEITEYFTISKSQAKSSYWFSIVSCVIGILMLGLAIYGAVAIENIQLTIIGTVSGAIIEVISGTVLWIHNKSALQLNHYYNALHENEKFLSAINIADKLSADTREEMYKEIIRKQIEIQNKSE